MYRDFEESLTAETEIAECVPVESTHPLYILYTSGTTGTPKGIVRDTGGTVVVMKWSMENIWDLRRGDCHFATSDIGWIVGHSYIVYGPLVAGVTSVFFDGKPHIPNAGIIWEKIQQYKVTSLFSAPTAIRLLKKEDYDGEYLKKWNPTSLLKGLAIAGERCDP